MTFGHEGGHAFNEDQRGGHTDQPRCGKCGKVMTRENARLRPELFLHDACLPDELKPAAGPTIPPPTEADLAELRRLDKEAAPPPWKAMGNTLYIGDDWIVFLGHRESVGLIAAARNHLSAVLERLAAAEADRDRLRGLLRKAAGDLDAYRNPRLIDEIAAALAATDPSRRA